METGPVDITIRPEAVSLSPTSPANRRFIEGTMAKASYLGAHMEYTVESPLGPLFIIDDAVSRPLARDSAVFTCFTDHGIALIRR
jgi:iron(III) transport system ATP-binding protein